jgi:hypothetical protein
MRRVRETTQHQQLVGRVLSVGHALTHRLSREIKHFPDDGGVGITDDGSDMRVQLVRRQCGQRKPDQFPASFSISRSVTAVLFHEDVGERMRSAALRSVSTRGVRLLASAAQ